MSNGFLAEQDAFSVSKKERSDAVKILFTGFIFITCCLVAHGEIPERFEHLFPPREDVSKEELVQNMNNFELDDLLIKENIIIQCEPDLLSSFDFSYFFRLTNIVNISGGGDIASSNMTRVIFEDPRQVTYDRAIPSLFETNIMFLVEKQVDKDYRDKYNLLKSDRIFTPCKGRYACFSFPHRVRAPKESNMGNSGYIDDEFISVMKGLTAWRNNGLDRAENVDNLVKLLNSAENSTYSEFIKKNAPPLIKHLGACVYEKDGVYDIRK